MSNTTTRVLDLIPDSLKPQLIMEALEFVEQINSRKHLISFDQEEPQDQEPADQKQIDEIVNTIIP